jgi:hypothetical protein
MSEDSVTVNWISAEMSFHQTEALDRLRWLELYKTAMTDAVISGDATRIRAGIEMLEVAMSQLREIVAVGFKEEEKE